MEKTIVSKKVKLEILTICSGSIARPEILSNNIVLSLPGYNEWCRLSGNRLQYIASQFNTGKEMPPLHVNATAALTQRIQMVI